VSVLIDDETREHGVIAPLSANPRDNIIVSLGYLSRNCVLKSGQRVITSGLGGIFPRGILVGHVADFWPVDHGVSIEARVRVAVNLNALEEVWVLLP
jgi:rod shape-determining protein MreC